MHKNIVISGINIVEGGALTVFKDCINNLIENGYTKKNNITILVHNKKIFEEYVDSKINIVEFEKSKSSWIKRLYYEYVYFYFWSKNKNIDTWISIHDVTPNVKAKKRYVYCHNPSPFYKINKEVFKYDKKLFLFSIFYKYLYKINIRKNNAVIVQQNWIKQEFEKMYKINNVIVARPDIKVNDTISKINYNKNKDDNKYSFIYAAFPRVFKNFEVICEACDILKKQQTQNFEVILTIDGSENLYSKNIVEKYKENDKIKFIGLQKQKDLFDLYSNCDCMIFSSKLETWGLPITEFKQTRKTIILADLPYAHETVGNYEKIVFFEPEDANELAIKMIEEMNNVSKYTINNIENKGEVSSWQELLRKII